MNGSIRLSDYATVPRYNIKAVVQATGITPSTLRAWERRYNMGLPQRTESGYRLYSDRDLAILRWLKAQVDAGMTISHAVKWMNSIVDGASRGEDAVLPEPGANSGMSDFQTVQPVMQTTQAHDYSAMQDALLVALLAFSEIQTDEVMAEAFSMYSVEQVGENIIGPVLVEIGERWHRGEITTTTEHFASNYLLQRLSALLRFMPVNSGSPTIWVGCAPGELHEVGAVLLSIYLRRVGYDVHYLGQNLHVDDVAADAARRRPDMIVLSASSEESASQLASLSGHLAGHSAYRPLVGYGGRIFNEEPELRDKISGVYLGATAVEAVRTVRELLSDKAHATGRN